MQEGKCFQSQIYLCHSICPRDGGREDGVVPCDHTWDLFKLFHLGPPPHNVYILVTTLSETFWLGVWYSNAEQVWIWQPQNAPPPQNWNFSWELWLWIWEPPNTPSQELELLMENYDFGFENFKTPSSAKKKNFSWAPWDSDFARWFTGARPSWTPGLGWLRSNV